MCIHQPRCPDARAPDHASAHVLASHPEQGWSLLCNGIVLFDDLGELILPYDQAISFLAGSGAGSPGQKPGPMKRDSPGKRACENMAYVRMLVRKKLPEFVVILEWVERELDSCDAEAQPTIAEVSGD